MFLHIVAKFQINRPLNKKVYSLETPPSGTSFPPPTRLLRLFHLFLDLFCWRIFQRSDLHEKTKNDLFSIFLPNCLLKTDIQVTVRIAEKLSKLYFISVFTVELGNLRMSYVIFSYIMANPRLR